ncbi:hypothetical protein [Salipiger mangrovisoli]|uniref:Uncharacterized protein n=1 Tax=Salipiger mangrovisoli TaxID=2865933 RepID=A0ABR9XAG9_9RHOB|nr:hypothetical protein [Salipiger mangrovisoli]MBE9640486.1 hypothetical protein [Salipiger mangrovisoli]
MGEDPVIDQPEAQPLVLMLQPRPGGIYPPKRDRNIPYREMITSEIVTAGMVLTKDVLRPMAPAEEPHVQWPPPSLISRHEGHEEQQVQR